MSKQNLDSPGNSWRTNAVDIYRSIAAGDAWPKNCVRHSHREKSGAASPIFTRNDLAGSAPSGALGVGALGFVWPRSDRQMVRLGNSIAVRRNARFAFMLASYTDGMKLIMLRGFGFDRTS